MARERMKQHGVLVIFTNIFSQENIHLYFTESKVCLGQTCQVIALVVNLIYFSARCHDCAVGRLLR